MHFPWNCFLVLPYAIFLELEFLLLILIFMGIRSRGPRCKLVVRVSNLTLYTPNSRGGGKPHMTAWRYMAN